MSVSFMTLLIQLSQEINVSEKIRQANKKFFFTPQNSDKAYGFTFTGTFNLGKPSIKAITNMEIKEDDMTASTLLN